MILPSHSPRVSTKRLKSYVHTKTCTQMFIEALFIIDKIKKEPRCPSTGEQKRRKKLRYIQTNGVLFSTERK